MTEFVMGLVLGGLLVFTIMEYHRWKSRIVSGRYTADSGTEAAQWANMMNYDGSERGQMNYED